MSTAPERKEPSPRAAALREAALARAQGFRSISATRHGAEAQRRAGPSYRHAPPSPQARLGAGSLAFCALAPLALAPFAWIGAGPSPLAQPASILLAWACAFALCAGAASARAHFSSARASRRTRPAFAWASSHAHSPAALAALGAIRAHWTKAHCDDAAFCRPADSWAPSLAGLQRAASTEGGLDAILAHWEARLSMLGAPRASRCSTREPS